MNTKRLVLASAAIAAATGAGGAYWFYVNSPTELRLAGTVETQEVRLSSRVGGRIYKIAVREGETVREGQELVYLEAPELQARRDQLQAALDAAQAQLAKAESGPRPEEKTAARAAAKVAQAKLDRIRAGYRTEEVKMAYAEWQALVADLDRWRSDWQREQRLGTTT